MGAWGFGLFESDHDWEMIHDLSQETGIKKLEADDRALAGQDVEPEAKISTLGYMDVGEHTYMYRNCMTTGETKPLLYQMIDQIVADKVHYSIFAGVTTDLQPVREHLESAVLQDMMAKYEPKMPTAGNFKGYHEDGYKLILLGAGAMTHGCHLPKGFKALMISHYWNVGLMRDALKQIAKALNGPNGYVEGEPYEFGSRNPVEVMEDGGTPRADRVNKRGRLINVPEPHALEKIPALSERAVRDVQARVAEEVYGEDVCGGCGAKEGKDGSKLDLCSKCHKRKYCSRECQKKHWTVHKLVCGAPKGTKKEELRKDAAVEMHKLQAKSGVPLEPGKEHHALADLSINDPDARKTIEDHIKKLVLNEKNEQKSKKGGKQNKK